jgi:hypothetical protein
VAYSLEDDASHDFSLEPPTCQIHYWREGTGLISHLTFIDPFDGPYPFCGEDGKYLD